MQTIDEFRYTLTFRNMVGGSRSFEDLQALRDILVEHGFAIASSLGRAGTQLWADDLPELAHEIETHKTQYLTLVEADIIAIDAFLERRLK